MRSRVKDMKNEVLAPEVAKDGCHHYWLIEAAKGPTSRGVCKVCGATKDFFNAVPQPDSTVVRRHVAFTEMPKLEVDPDSQPNQS